MSSSPLLPVPPGAPLGTDGQGKTMVTAVKRAPATIIAALSVLLAGACAEVSNLPTVSRDKPGMTCGAHTVPVRLDAGAAATNWISGDLCYPGGTRPAAVQVLLAGATYSRTYWNPDGGGPRSYVAAATRAGYAVFNADRVGTGTSSHPPSDTLDVTAGAQAVRDVVAALRSGDVDGHRFGTVILVAHSLGAAVGWEVGDAVDALVLSSELHRINPPVWNSLAVQPAGTALRFSARRLDGGYVTTAPGSRTLFHHGADAATVRADEDTKDLSTLAELTEARTLVDSPDPRTAPSARITAPVLVVIGQYDTIFCTRQCGRAAVLAQERPYYAAAAAVDVAVLPGVGHSLNLHPSAPELHATILGWLARTSQLARPEIMRN